MWKDRPVFRWRYRELAAKAMKTWVGSKWDAAYPQEDASPNPLAVCMLPVFNTPPRTDQNTFAFCVPAFGCRRRPHPLQRACPYFHARMMTNRWVRCRGVIVDIVTYYQWFVMVSNAMKAIPRRCDENYIKWWFIIISILADRSGIWISRHCRMSLACHTSALGRNNER